jgi:hypothetical protein
VTTLSPETALDILASHGADPARWPAGSRDALLALAGSDAGVAAALAGAQAVDGTIAEWLDRPVPALAVDVAAITVLPQTSPQAAPARWRPALLAASLALVVAVSGWLGVENRFGGDAAIVVATAPPPPAGAELAEADAAFAYVFTPTAAEEDLI